MEVVSPLGLGEAWWIALTAVGTFGLVLVTALTLYFLRAQLITGHQAQAAGLLERALSDLNRSRIELYELKAKVRRQITFSWDELKALRETVFSYQQFLPALQSAVRYGDREIWGDAVDRYMEEIDILTKVLGEGNDQCGRRIEILKKDVSKFVEVFFKEYEVGEEDRKEYLRIASEEKARLSEFTDILKAKFFVKRDMSASDISAFLKRSKDQKPLRYDALSAHGGDGENMALLDAWVDEISDMLARMRNVLERLKKLVEAA